MNIKYTLVMVWKIVYENFMEQKKEKNKNKNKIVYLKGIVYSNNFIFINKFFPQFQKNRIKYLNIALKNKYTFQHKSNSKTSI